MKAILILMMGLYSANVIASQFPKVDTDLANYDQTLTQMKSEFGKTSPNPQDKNWVKSKLAFMFQIDQYMRAYWKTPYDHQYTEDEEKFFTDRFMPRSQEMDLNNTTDLKSLLKIYHWFKISEFGETADNQAWLIVQHADQDSSFQKQILSILEKLYPIKETQPKNFAYLFDRIAASFSDTSKRTLQRFGTQGQCVGPEKWEPIPMEDPEHVDERRAAMGMSTMAEYIALFKNICH